MAVFTGWCLPGHTAMASQTAPPGSGMRAANSRAAGSKPAVRCPSQQETGRTLAKASAQLEQAQFSGAIETLETFSTGPCDARISLLLAAAYEANGDLPRAEETLAQAHAEWPADTSIAASLAREYMNAGEADRAVKVLIGFRVSATTPLQEMQEAVIVDIAGHRLVPAQLIAEAACKSYPSLATLLLLANVLQLEGRYKDVNRLLAGERKNYAGSADFLITIAESESDAMLLDAAHADLEHAIALDAKSYQAHYLFGNVLAAQNETGHAEQEYRTAIELAPDQPRTYYQLALLYRARQDEDKEWPLLTQALAADDQYAPAHCEMGRILMGQRRLDDAVTQLKLAIQDNPQLEQAYYLLARAYGALGQKDKADAMVSRYTALRAANRRSSVDTHPGQLGAGEGTQ